MDPVKTTPDPASGNAPAWAVKAMNEIFQFKTDNAFILVNEGAAIIAKHYYENIRHKS